MGMSAGISISFLDEDKKKIGTMHMDCYKCRANCQIFNIPKNSVSVKVCFSTEYEKCDDCQCADNEESDDPPIYSDDSDDEDDDGFDEVDSEK